MNIKNYYQKINILKKIILLKFFIEFFKDQKNLKNINCFSDEGDKWEKSYTSINNNILKIKFREKFLFRRGRINCSLNDNGMEMVWYSIFY